MLGRCFADLFGNILLRARLGIRCNDAVFFVAMGFDEQMDQEYVKGDWLDGWVGWVMMGIHDKATVLS